MIAERCGYFQHFLDFPGRIRRMENGCSGHQNLSAGCDDIRQVTCINPSIDLDNTSIVAAFDNLPCLADFLQRIRNEFLAPKAGVHTHDQ